MMLSDIIYSISKNNSLPGWEHSNTTIRSAYNAFEEYVNTTLQDITFKVYPGANEATTVVLLNALPIYTCVSLVFGKCELESIAARIVAFTRPEQKFRQTYSTATEVFAAGTKFNLLIINKYLDKEICGDEEWFVEGKYERSSSAEMNDISMCNSSDALAANCGSNFSTIYENTTIMKEFEGKTLPQFTRAGQSYTYTFTVNGSNVEVSKTDLPELTLSKGGVHQVSISYGNLTADVGTIKIGIFTETTEQFTTLSTLTNKPTEYEMKKTDTEQVTVVSKVESTETASNIYFTRYSDTASADAKAPSGIITPATKEMSTTVKETTPIPAHTSLVATNASLTSTVTRKFFYILPQQTTFITAQSATTSETSTFPVMKSATSQHSTTPLFSVVSSSPQSISGTSHIETLTTTSATTSTVSTTIQSTNSPQLTTSSFTTAIATLAGTVLESTVGPAIKASTTVAQTKSAFVNVSDIMKTISSLYAPSSPDAEKSTTDVAVTTANSDATTLTSGTTVFSEKSSAASSTTTPPE
uniref:PA14 domain-containing protein n=1 Tax=Syphacia muris TaxID=451379 RepID=A0A0N5ACE5_9BILA